MAAAPEDRLEKRRRNRLRALIAATESEGARLQFWARTASLSAIAVVFASILEWNAALAYVLGWLFVFFLSGLINYWLARTGSRPSWFVFATGTMDIVLLTIIIVTPNPFAGYNAPAAMGLREAGFKYLLVIMCLGALSLSPRLALWLGIAAAICWSLAVAWVVVQPGAITAHGAAQDYSYAQRLQFYLDPNFVDLVEQMTNVVIILIIAGIIATVVSRARHLADDYTKAERARFNLARHFSPNVVDQLASDDEPFGPIRRQDVAVVFADIVGFTAYTEDHQPEQVFQMLREFHRRMEQVVFENQGTVDNYIGDCIMATFGVPRPAPNDSARALRAARGMIASLDDWNRERSAAGRTPVDIRIGCQYGPVVMGAVGSERNMSYAAVGDTCNVASRMQTMCKDLNADICVGAPVIEAALQADDHDAIAGFINHGPVHVRGREGLVDVWYLPNPENNKD